MSLLEPCTIDGSRATPPPDPVLVDGEEEEYLVEKILDSKYRHNRLRYLVKWQGYSDLHNSWEPGENLAMREVDDDGPSGEKDEIPGDDLVKAFHEKYPGKPGPELVKPHRGGAGQTARRRKGRKNA